MLSKELEVTLNNAFKNAHDKRHEFITVEHLLLGLLDNSTARPVLKACGCDIPKLQKELNQYIDETISLIPEGIQRETQPTLGFQRVLQRAVFHVQATDKKEVTGANLFVALFSEQDSHAVYLLNKHNISRLDVVNYLAHGVSKLDSDNENEADGESDMPSSISESSESPLDKYA
ncbi:MAG: Clp protease N-terminal domain-containing protein, partial [Methylicorpusculum sp.]|nr:Clp protease N-terminal domain-containing protein [Methylicorpusculum sp.]